jgi:hypothetical protein
MEFGTRAEDISAAMGPCIARCSYEVGPEVAAAFSAQFAQAREWIDVPHELRHGLSDDQFVAGEGPNPLKWLSMMPPGHDPPPPTVQLDLIAANRWQLRDAGVLEKNISDSGLCTACRTDLLFSHRREQGRTGRMLAAIGIRDWKSRGHFGLACRCDCGTFNQRELAAGGHDVLSARNAYKREDAFIHQNLLERLDAFLRRPLIGKLSGIPRDQIYF